jgi:hypothetical protein
MAICTDPRGATKHSQLWKPRLMSGQDAAKGCQIYMPESSEMVAWILKDEQEGRTVPLDNP